MNNSLEIYELYRRIHGASMLADRVFDDLIKPIVGITRRQFWILLHLQMEGTAGMTQTELARHVGLSPMALGKMLDRTEKIGSTQRIPDPQDRRSNRIVITQSGRALLALIDTQPAVSQRQSVSALSVAQIDQLNQLLDRLRQSLTATLAGAGPKGSQPIKKRVERRRGSSAQATPRT